MKFGKLANIRSFIFSVEENRLIQEGKIATFEADGLIFCFSRAGREYEFNPRSHTYVKKADRVKGEK